MTTQSANRIDELISSSGAAIEDDAEFSGQFLPLREFDPGVQILRGALVILLLDGLQEGHHSRPRCITSQRILGLLWYPLYSALLLGSYCFVYLVVLYAYVAWRGGHA